MITLFISIIIQLCGEIMMQETILTIIHTKNKYWLGIILRISSAAISCMDVSTIPANTLYFGTQNSLI